MANDMVVKTNRLNMAIQNLSLIEVRIIQLAIIDARETETGLSTDKPLVITASRYAEAFDVSRQTARQAILDAEQTLFERRFTFIDDTDGNPVKSRWLQRVKYLNDQAAIELCFTYDVVTEITRIDGIERYFTQYLLQQTSQLKSAYSVRLYELLVQWKEAKRTRVFEINTFREQLGLGVNEYQIMGNFKLRVLDMAVNEINEKTDLKVSYEQKKQGRKITGFQFKVLVKAKPIKDKESSLEGKIHIHTVEGLSDKQLARIARNKRFIADYNDLVSSTSPAGQDLNAWEVEMVSRLKQNPSQFNKSPIRDYLN